VWTGWCSIKARRHLCNIQAVSLGATRSPTASRASETLRSFSLTNVTIPDRVTSVGDFVFSGCFSLGNITLGSGVTSIGVSAFSGIGAEGKIYGCPLINVSIPNSVTNISNYAFAYCSSLTGVAIPNSVISIGDRAFNGTSLTNITLGSGVTGIGDYAFAGCSSLTNIVVDPLNSAFSSVDGVLFNHNLTTLVQYPGGRVGDYTIPNSVTSIGGSAFTSCSGLTSVTIPNSVTSIGEAAFIYCNLTSIILGAGVTSIGDYAFDGCSILTSVTIPNSVAYIGRFAFSGCASLTSIYFEGNAPSLGADVFFSDNNATAYYLPGTTGWGSTFGGIPTALWTLPYPLIINSSLGVRSNQFGFTVSWATNLPVVVEASADLKTQNWSPVQTNVLNNGVVNFTDPQWKNYPSRFYRVRSQ